MNKDIGIYIHIPFCKSKCFYCNFYSEEKKDSTVMENYIDAVCMEIMQNADLLSTRRITTIYIGGGTPSLLNPKQIKKILDVLKLFCYEPEEVTIEVNPESVTEEKLKEYHNMGINRLSIGIQSINEKTLKYIGRSYTSKENIKNVIEVAEKVGINNISADCIIGLPEETEETFKNTVEYILSLGKSVKHISAYSLEVHEGTKIDFLINGGFISLPSEETERNMKYALDKILEENGFERYEISNYAKKGYESKHNLKYWNKEEYLGLGSAASSYINSSRYTNIDNVEQYINSVQNGISTVIFKEDLDEIEDIKEYIILRLRLKEGLNIDTFKSKFGKDILSLYKEEITELINNGLLIIKDNNITLTYKGEDLANLVWEKFI